MLGGEIKVMTTLQPQAVSGAVEGTAVDTAGYDEAIVVFTCGLIAATGTLDVKMQECDTSDGTFEDITGAAFTQCTPSNDLAIYVARIRCDGARKRFLKAHATQATATATGAVALILAGKNFTGGGSSLAFNV